MRSMENKYLRFFAFLMVTVQLTVPGVVSAETFETVSVAPNYSEAGKTQSLFTPEYRSGQSLPPASPQASSQTQANIPPQSQALRQFHEEKPSEFEQYIAEQVEITADQFEILRQYEGVVFLRQPKNLPGDKIAVPVRIIGRKTDEKGEEGTKETAGGQKKVENESVSSTIDAGYIVGNARTIAEAFKTLGIRSPLFVSTILKQFGYDFFKQPPSTFAPVEKVPVGPDYVIGPGDEIKIAIWGRVDGQWRVVVERDGTISLPKVGTVGVTGLTFKELKELLHKEVSKYYTGFEMGVSMGSLRTIRVYMVGNASKPGAYTISSLSTLVNALFEAGGPSKTGTMRDIQLKRNGKTVVHFDLYDFLLRGDKTNDLRLMPEDVIFIPPVGPLAAVAGSVNTPAIYELKGEKKLSQLIEMAGGMSTVAFKGRVQIERIVDGQRQTVFESDMDVVRDSDLAIQSGDVVKIFQVVQDKRTVRLSGAVQREGEYGYSPNMTIKDLLSMAGGLKYYAYNKDAELTRVEVTDQGPKTEKIVINIQKALGGDPVSNIKLKENDYLFIRSVPEWQLYRTVAVQGEVRFPGLYTIKKGEKLSSLIERSGGYTGSAYLRGAVFVRERVKELQQKSLDEMILRLERELLVSSSAQVSAASSAEEVQAKQAELESKKAFIEVLKKQKATGRMTIRLAHLRLLKGSDYDIELEEGDSLFIPTRNSVVNVTGAVMSQSSLIYSEKLDYKEYIEMAGGYSKHADSGSVYVLKADGSARRLSKGFIGWNPFQSRWEMTSFGEEIKGIEPGDTIVVPEKLERIAWLREIKDITQIIMQMAVTAGVVLKLY